MFKSIVLDSICESLISDGFDNTDEEELNYSCRFNGVIFCGLEGPFVEFFRFISLEYSKVEGLSLEAIVNEFRESAVFAVEVSNSLSATME